MKIAVKMSWPLSEPVTVQWFCEDGEVDECNHAGAELEEQTSISWNYSSEDIDEDTYAVLICDKCGRYQTPEGFWELP